MRRTGLIRSLAALFTVVLLLGASIIDPASAQMRPVAGGGADVGTEPLPAHPDTARFTITSVSIPVSDTVRLHGRLYRPVTDSAVATLFSMTPYTADDAHEYGSYFARHGYAYVNVDVRGRGGSDGTFRPLVQDGPDGAAVVDWISRQPWSDGRVAMRGGSYRGMVQWQTLAHGAEALETVVPTASAYPGWDFPNEHGIFGSYAARWLSLVQGRASQGSLFGDEDYWDAKFATLHRRGAAFHTLDDLTGISSRIFEEWIEHPHLDDYWTAPSPAPADYRRFDLPILTVTGYFDGDQPGALRYYRKHMRHGSPEGRARHHLLIGPWSHGGTRHPEREHDGLTFADTAAIDMTGLHLRWFDWVLREGANPPLLDDRVTYYVMGADRWRSASSLDAVADTSRTLYLHSPEKTPDDPFDAGHLSKTPPVEPDTDQYVYDPRTTADMATLEAMEDDLTAPGAAFLDGPKLIYHSAPLKESIEVSGQMQLDAWIELDVPDTDVGVWVYEIRPTGQTIHLGHTALRARHRNGVDTVTLAEPGRVYRYRFDRFHWTSRQLRAGSRLRLVIAPLNTPGVQKNYQSGGVPMQESGEDVQTATVKLHAVPNRQSALILPVRSDEAR